MASTVNPYADKNGRIIEFDKILLSGAQFIKQQVKGYQMYQNFYKLIIPDSAYMQYLFDSKGYQKALLDIEEQFYYSWQKSYYRNNDLSIGEVSGINDICCLTD